MLNEWMSEFKGWTLHCPSKIGINVSLYELLIVIKKYLSIVIKISLMKLGLCMKNDI